MNLQITSPRIPQVERHVLNPITNVSQGTSNPVLVQMAEEARLAMIRIQEQNPENSQQMPQYWTSALHLATCYEELQAFEQSEVLLRQVLQLRTNSLPSGHPDITTSTESLRNFLIRRGRHEDSLTFAEAALQMRENEGTSPQGRPKKETVNAHFSLGMVLHKLKRYADAERHLAVCLECRVETLGYEHPLVLSTINNLAMLYQDWMKFEEAIKLLEKCVLLKRRTLGHSHPSTLTSIVNLASSLEKKGDSTAASLYMREVVSVHRARQDMPALLKTLNMLCSSLQNLPNAVDDHVRARQEIVILTRRQHGHNDPATLKALSTYGKVLKSAGRLEEAEPYYLEYALAKEQALGKDHLDTSLALNNLATLYKAMNRLSKAEQIFQTCVDKRWIVQMAEQLPLPRERHTLNLMNNLAMCIALDPIILMETYAERTLTSQQLSLCHARIEYMLRYLYYGYKASCAALDAEDADRLNMTGNFGLCLVTYCPQHAEQGWYMVRYALNELRGQGYGDEHPWMKKLLYAIQHQLELARSAAIFNKSLPGEWTII